VFFALSPIPSPVKVHVPCDILVDSDSTQKPVAF